MSKRVNLRPSSSGKVQRPYWNVSMKHNKKKRTATEVQAKCVSVARSIICWGWNVLVHMIHCREWACARAEKIDEPTKTKNTAIRRVSLFKFTSTSAVPGSEEEMRREKNVNKSWAEQSKSDDCTDNEQWREIRECYDADGGKKETRRHGVLSWAPNECCVCVSWLVVVWPKPSQSDGLSFFSDFGRERLKNTHAIVSDRLFIADVIE